MTDSEKIVEECRPRIKKISRRRRHRSVERQQRYPSAAKTHTTNVIHTRIRPFSNTSVPQNKLLALHDDIKSFATNMGNHQQQGQSSNSRTFLGSSKKPRRSISLTTLPRLRSEISQSSQHTRKTNNSNRITPQQDNHFELQKTSKRNNVDNQQRIYMLNTRSDGHANIKEHHNHLERKNKKKHPHLCIIVALIVAILIIITISIVLPVLLIKPKKTITTPTTNIELRWNSTGITIAGITGQFGVTTAHLTFPFGLAIDYADTLYIAEYGGHRIQRRLKDSSVGEIIAGQVNATSGIGLSDLSSPAGLLIDSDSNLYIADCGNSRVLFWPKDAISGQMIAGDGSLGNASNQLYTTFGISRDSTSGTIYVADFGNHRIMLYASNATSGTLVAGGNGPGMNLTQLYHPTSVYFDSPTNSLLIVNHFGHNIVRWTLGDSNWTLVAGSTNVTFGITETLLHLPIGMILDPMGNIYVADTLNHRIQLFMAGQSVGRTIAGTTNVFGDNSTLLSGPYSLILDNQLNLYVADTNNHRVQKFLRY